MKENTYYRFGKPYKKLQRHEIIREGAMQSWCNGELNSIMEDDIVGQTPNQFSDERDFYNPVDK